MIMALTKKDITDGGVEIHIEGLTGDPKDRVPGTSIYLEYYDNKVQLHVWTDGKQDCQTIILT